MDKGGFSSDGYIVDQKQLLGFPYGRYSSDWNGCGWIAAYNLLRSQGRDVSCEEIRREMSDRLRFGGFFGTSVGNVRSCLSRRGLKTALILGKRRALSAASKAPGGVLRFHDGEYPHYVAFSRERDGLCRFYNADSEEERYVLSMEDFYRIHVTGCFVRALILNKT